MLLKELHSSLFGDLKTHKGSDAQDNPVYVLKIQNDGFRVIHAIPGIPRTWKFEQRSAAVSFAAELCYSPHVSLRP